MNREEMEEVDGFCLPNILIGDILEMQPVE